MANSTEYIYTGMLKMLDEWVMECTCTIDHMAEAGSTSLECHEEAAEEGGFIRHKIDAIYDMALINIKQYRELIDIYKTSLKEITDYIWDELFLEAAE